MSKYFRSETGVCIMCGDSKTFHPRIESQWSVIEQDGRHFYVCKKCLSDYGERGDQAAYGVQMNKIMRKIQELSK
jgi:hypothetical protein